MSAPVIPDSIEASCQAPGLWLVQGCLVQRVRSATKSRQRTYWTVDGLGRHRTLSDAIEYIADRPHAAPRRVCTCGAREYPGCFCGLTLREFLATPGERSAV